MKRKGFLALALATVMLLAACTPAAPPPVAPPDAQPPREGIVQPPPVTPPPPTVEETGLQPGIIVITRDEPPVVAPGRHNAVAGSYMNAMNFNALF